MQEFIAIAAFDLAAGSLDDLRSLLRGWTEAAATLTKGQVFEPERVRGSEAPADTGEALGLGPAGLTITVGVGPELFESDRDLGLESKRPPVLRRLPAFPGESLDSARSNGDLCIQACADDPQVAFHAIHVLTRLAADVATLRWLQQGFGRTSSVSRSQKSARNLMGFKDGTANIRKEDAEAMREFVWVRPGDGPIWMSGGSYLVMRKIRILFDVWDATSLDEQERVIGREKVSGAPLGGRRESDPVDLSARRDGVLEIPSDAHIRLASPSNSNGQRLLRRGYSYSEPAEPDSGQLDAGLLFICFARDPSRQFISLQRRLATFDALSRHTLHVASGLFACPPGPRRGGFIGEGLFD